MTPRLGSLAQNRRTGLHGRGAAIEPAQRLRTLDGIVAANQFLADDDLKAARIGVEDGRLDAGMAMHARDHQAFDSPQSKLRLKSFRIEGAEEALEKYALSRPFLQFLRTLGTGRPLDHLRRPPAMGHGVRAVSGDPRADMDDQPAFGSC